MALTDFAAFMDTVQAPVPEQAPPQPWKVAPPKVAAVKVTVWPAGNDTDVVVVPSGPTAQVAPLQARPPGDDVMLALPTAPRPPLMCAEKLSKNAAPLAPTPVNLAMTLWFAVMVRVQVVAAPEHAPPQPTQVDPAAGVSVKTTDVPA